MYQLRMKWRTQLTWSVKHLTAKMGLFEEIERAWFTVDNKLFLWDYTDG